jgi:SAM-dependent methyltransferase
MDNVISSWPEHAAARNTHNRMFEIVQRHIGDVKETFILDMPCGAGLFSSRLAQAGMQVTAMDIEAVEPFKFDSAHRVLADANLGLPFDSEKFDALVTIEGIEHLENPRAFLRECARVVKPRGWVFLSTPNVDSLRSRKGVLVRGYHRYFGPRGEGVKDSGHMLPVDMIFFRGAAKLAGLEIVEVNVNELSGKSWFKELLRPMLVRSLPLNMRGEIPFYGDVILYALRKA